MPQMVEMLYRPIEYLEIDTNLFSSFIRRQIVEDWWYKADGQWIVKSDPFIDDWSEADYISLVQHLRNTIRMGGVVLGAFSDGKLKGFASVEGTLLGYGKQYEDLSKLHVSQDKRGVGIGRNLFMEAKEYAKKFGAKNYIYQQIRQLKRKPFIKLWDALKH